MKRDLSVRLNFKVLWALLVAPGILPGTAAEALPPSNPKALTLEEAIRVALENNPSLRASAAEVDAASAREFQGRKWSNPELELAAEEWPVEKGHGFSDAKRTIGVAQTVPFPGKKSLDRRIGSAGVKLSDAELVLRQTELVRDVKVSFFSVLTAAQRLAVADELLKVAESSAATARKRVEAGAAAYQEQLRAEILLEQVRVELSNDQRALEVARQGLFTMLGRPEFRDVQLAGTLSESTDTEEAGPPGREAKEKMLRRHPSYRAAQANVDRARLETRRARLQSYPDVKTGVAGGRLGDTDESIIELRFSVPLPLFDTGKGKRREADAQLARAEADLEAIRQQLQSELASALGRCRAATAQIAHYRQHMLPKAQEALRLVRTGFEDGKFGLIDLLDIQRTDAEARRAYLEKLFELNSAQAELDSLLGATPDPKPLALPQSTK